MTLNPLRDNYLELDGRVLRSDLIREVKLIRSRKKKINLYEKYLEGLWYQ